MDRSVSRNPPSGIKREECTARSPPVSADASPRDYEAMAGLSLLAWGDSWSRRRRGNADSKCGGGGWKVKGGDNVWEGTLAVGDECDSGGAVDASDSDFPPTDGRGLDSRANQRAVEAATCSDYAPALSFGRVPRAE